MAQGPFQQARERLELPDELKEGQAAARVGGRRRRSRFGGRLAETEQPKACHRAADLTERYRRLARRRGDKKAIIAIAHEILTATWHVLTNGELYREQGPDIISQRDIENTRRRAIRPLERLGHEVILETLPDAA